MPQWCLKDIQYKRFIRDGKGKSYSYLQICVVVVVISLITIIFTEGSSDFEKWRRIQWPEDLSTSASGNCCGIPSMGKAENRFCRYLRAWLIMSENNSLLTFPSWGNSATEESAGNGGWCVVKSHHHKQKNGNNSLDLVGNQPGKVMDDPGINRNGKCLSTGA